MTRAWPMPSYEEMLENVAMDPNTGCWLWTKMIADTGYGAFIRNSKRHGAHRHMLTLVTGPRPSTLFACHKCDTPSCVNPDHLFWGTKSDNTVDMWRKGRAHIPNGEANGNARLTDDQVRTIRKLWKLRRQTQRQIAAQYGVTQSLVSHIVRGRAWAALEG